MWNLFLLVAACRNVDEPPLAPAVEIPTEAEAEAERDWAAFLLRVEKQIVVEEVPGIQVAIVLDGKLRYTGSAGVVAFGVDEAVTDETVFRWASVSKMHTATAVLQLADDGLLDLDAPVTDVLDDAALATGFDPATVTTRHLLTHTAALPDELDWACGTRGGLLRDRVTSWAPPLFAPPGSFYNYSNTGYVWAGALIEELTGEPFIDAMQARVLDPAGMTTATYDAQVAGEGPHATGSGWYDGVQEFPLEVYDCAWSRPAAWLHGTATDLARTAEWQLAGGGALLSPTNTEAMHAQVDSHFLPDDQFEVGFGQFTSPYKDVTMVWHDGFVTGFVSTWAIVPGTGFGVAVVANADWADPYDLMYDAIDLFLDQPDDDAPSYATASSKWGAYAGTYVDPYVYGTIEVFLEGDTLYARFVDYQEVVEMAQTAEDSWTFQLDGAWTDVRFIRDDSDAYRWFVMRGGVGTRGDEDAAAAVAPGADGSASPLDPEAWHTQVRRYAHAERPDPRRLRPAR